MDQGAGTAVGTTLASPRVNLPSLTAMMVTPFWGTCCSGVKVMAPGDAFETGRGLDGALECRAVHAAGTRGGVGEQVDRVIAQCREGVLGSVAVLGGVGVDERLDAVRAALGIHQRVGREEHVVRGGPCHLTRCGAS